MASEIVNHSAVAGRLKVFLCRNAGLDPKVVSDGWEARHDGGDDVVVTFQVVHYMPLSEFNSYVEESRK